MLLVWSLVSDAISWSRREHMKAILRRHFGDVCNKGSSLLLRRPQSSGLTRIASAPCLPCDDSLLYRGEFAEIIRCDRVLPFTPQYWSFNCHLLPSLTNDASRVFCICTLSHTNSNITHQDYNVGTHCRVLATSTSSNRENQVLLCTSRSNFALVVCLWAEKTLIYGNKDVLQIETVFVDCLLSRRLSLRRQPSVVPPEAVCLSDIIAAKQLSDSMASGQISPTCSSIQSDMHTPNVGPPPVPVSPKPEQSCPSQFDGSSSPEVVNSPAVTETSPIAISAPAALLPTIVTSEDSNCGSIDSGHESVGLCSPPKKQDAQRRQSLVEELVYSQPEVPEIEHKLEMADNKEEEALTPVAPAAIRIVALEPRSKSHDPSSTSSLNSEEDDVPTSLNRRGSAKMRRTMAPPIRGRRYSLFTNVVQDANTPVDTLMPTLNDVWGGRRRSMSPQTYMLTPPRGVSPSGSVRRRPSMIPPAVAEVKPPNVLIFTGSDDKTSHVHGGVVASVDMYDRLMALVRRCVVDDTYAIYHLSLKRLLSEPWAAQTACLIVTDTDALDENAWQRLQTFFRDGGKILFVCRNRLLATMTECTSNKKRVELLKMMFSNKKTGNNMAGSSLGKDFEQFLKKICKQLKKKHICEVFRPKDLSKGGIGYSITVLKEEGSPLVLYMSNGKKQAGALFTDATLENLLAEGSLIVYQALERLQMDLRPVEQILTERRDPDAYTPAYLILGPNTQNLHIYNEYCNMDVMRGKLSVQFHSGVVGDAAATDKYLPIVVSEDRHAEFDSAAYFAHLQTEILAKAVVFVPVVTSTMNVIESLMSSMPQEHGIICIASHQTQGKGRSGNQWLSPAGCAMFSFPLTLSLHSKLGKVSGYLQHILALSAVQAVIGLPGYDDMPLRLKWPNDIYIGRSKKVGGVLVSCTIHKNQIRAILGCGLNVSNSAPTVCLNDCSGDSNVPPLCVEQVIAATLSKFEYFVAAFQESGPSAILPLYYECWLHERQEISIGTGGEKAVVRGLDVHGFLEVRGKGGRLFSLQPDGNTFDMMHNLVKSKS